MEVENAFVAKATMELEALRAQFEHQAGTTPPEDVLRQQVHQLYEAICSLSLYERPSPVPKDNALEADKAILAAWDKLLVAVRCLSATRPHGPFLASRMVLFITMAFGCQESLQFDAPDTEASRATVQLQLDYGFRLDECLLACLCQTWDESNETEDFRWATTHVAQGVKSEYNRKAMNALSAKELWEVPGMTGAQYWVAPPGEPPIYAPFEHSTSSTFGEVDETGKQPIIKQTIYSDGPLPWADMTFCLIGEDDSESWVQGRSLCRSYQFVIDVRQRLYHSIVQKRNALAVKAMTRGGLPEELQFYIKQDLEKPLKHPYLSLFDLSEAYRPFPPKHNQDCTICRADYDPQGGKAEAFKHQTCPRKSVTIWNLGLRTFHTFHESPRGKLAMCRQSICDGHHEDYSWAIINDAQLANYIRAFVKSRCGESATMKSIGLGPTWTPDNNLGCIRERPLASTFGLNEREVKLINEVQGGMYGLLATMFHQIVTSNACSLTDEPHACYTTRSEKDRWIRGRNKEEEERVGKDLSRLHREGHCAYPQWCRALVGPLADDGNLFTEPERHDRPFDQLSDTESARWNDDDDDDDDDDDEDGEDEGASGDEENSD